MPPPTHWGDHAPSRHPHPHAAPWASDGEYEGDGPTPTSTRPPPPAHAPLHGPADATPGTWGGVEGNPPPWKGTDEGGGGGGGGDEAFLLPAEDEGGLDGHLPFHAPPTHAWFPDPRPPVPSITLAVTLAGGQLGAAWHDGASKQVRLLQAAAEGAPPGCFGAPPPPPPALGLLLAIVRPARIIASAASDPRLLAGLRAGVDAMVKAGGNVGREAAPCPTLTLERPALFTLPAALRALECVRVAAAATPLASASTHAGWLGTRCGLASAPQQTAAAGALVAALLKGTRTQGGGVEASNSSGLLHLSSIGQAALPGALLVDQASLAALQVFVDEAHPSSALGIGRAKEGLSVAGLVLPRAVGPGAPHRRRLRAPSGRAPIPHPPTASLAHG